MTAFTERTTIAETVRLARVARKVADALDQLDHLTTDDFAHGGDRPGRLALVDALAALGWGYCRRCAVAAPDAGPCPECGRPMRQDYGERLDQ